MNMNGFELVRKYHKITEQFDATHCTGPISRDGRLPANNDEIRKVAVNCRGEWLKMKRDLALLGIGQMETVRLNALYLYSREYAEDMREIYGDAWKR